MDLDELRAFIAVVDAGSLSSAAATLTLSRTTVRRRIEALEARVGAGLVARVGPGVEVTAAGRQLAERGRWLLREATQIAEALRDPAAEPSGVIEVAIPPGLPPSLVTPMVAAWRQRFPRLSLAFSLSEDPLAELVSRADLAITLAEVGARAGPWVCLPAIRLREWLLASDAYLARHGVPESVEALAAHELLVWRPPGRDPCLLPTIDGLVRVEPRVQSADVHWLRHAAAAGIGIVFVPDAQLPEPALGPPLRPVLAHVVGRSFTATVAFSKGRAESPEMRAVLAHLVPLLERSVAQLSQLTAP